MFEKLEMSLLYFIDKKTDNRNGLLRLSGVINNIFYTHIRSCTQYTKSIKIHESDNRTYHF